jgi:hypothetical protein
MLSGGPVGQPYSYSAPRPPSPHRLFKIPAQGCTVTINLNPSKFRKESELEFLKSLWGLGMERKRVIVPARQAK